MEIAPKDCLKILGIPIGTFSQSKYDNKDIQDKIDKGKKLLIQLKIGKLASGTHEWSMLFESFLKSILIHNFTPLLAIDAKARTWADRSLIHVLIYALALPRFVPHSMIQLFAQLDITEEIVKKQLIKGSTNLNSSAALTR